MEALTALRKQIDLIDEALLELLAKRLDLVAEVGKIKHLHGLPIYVPEREAQMLAERIKQASTLGISAGLVEDILRRIMRESYTNENHFGFKTLNPDIKKVVVVGGKGKLGALFVKYLQLSGYHVAILDKNDWQDANTILANADVVIISVPITLTVSIIQRLSSFLNAKTLLVDLTSVKKLPLETMLMAHKGAVLGLHPMFGSDIASMAKQVIVQCDGRFPERYRWLIEQMQIWGAKFYPIDANEHDKHMTYIQALRHFSTFVNGLHLSKQPVQLAQLLALSSPIYRLELAMIGRLFAQDAELYADIILDKPENLAVISSFKASYEQGIRLLENGDKAGFIRCFEEIRGWFGEYSSQFLKESRALLQQVNDYR